MRIEVIQTEAGVYVEDEHGDMTEVPCQWFALCDNHAMLTEPHPVLGDVPICQRCKDRIDKLS